MPIENVDVVEHVMPVRRGGIPDMIASLCGPEYPYSLQFTVPIKVDTLKGLISD